MKISIIVPVYNVEKYLAECIDSILSQTLTDWELILVNDGSPDNCEKICLDYVKRDSRIKYVYQNNGGVSSARNKGISLASGEFLFFMDSDDTVCPTFLERAYLTAIKGNSDIVVLGKSFKNRMPLPAALPCMGFIVRNKFLKRFPEIIFPIGLQPCEDGLFSHQLLALTKKISFEPNVKYNYRKHNAQNHLQIKKSCDKTLSQIPQWFNILTSFYNKYNLWESHSLHLAKFLEHEPFELRYLDMPFNRIQHKQLFKIIHNFYKKNIRKNLKKQDRKKLTKRFRVFLFCPNYTIFNIYMCLF